jgi:hypothetical protein
MYSEGSQLDYTIGASESQNDMPGSTSNYATTIGKNSKIIV